jgi:hypothetical protein
LEEDPYIQVSLEIKIILIETVIEKIAILEFLDKETDNKLDDKIVATVKKALS